MFRFARNRRYNYSNKYILSYVYIMGTHIAYNSDIQT
jgi:hypothetical protein